MRIGTLSLLLTTLVSIPTLALDSSEPNGAVKLSWVRSESALDCISPSGLEADLVERMGRNPFEGKSGQWIEGFVVRVAGRYEVQLFERDGHGKTIGSRTFTEPSENCRALDDAIELAIALIIDPSVKLLERTRSVHQTLAEVSPQVPIQAPPRIAATEDARNAPLPSPEVKSSSGSVTLVLPAPVLHDAPTKSTLDAGHSTDFSAAGFLIGGLLPSAAAGVELGARHAEGLYALRLGLRLAPERRPDSRLGDFGFGATLLSAGGCARWRGTRLEWINCLEAGAGAVHVVVYRPTPDEPGDRFFAFAGLESGLTVRLCGPIWLDTRLFALMPLGRWNFKLTEDGQGHSVFQQKWFMPGAAAGLSVRFF